MENENNHKVDAWDASYERGENAIFFPQTRVVQFFNRNVVKKKSDNLGLSPILLPRGDRLTCLDFACGIGTHALFANEMGCDVVGVDISQKAIEIAKRRAENRNTPQYLCDFQKLGGTDTKLAFSDRYFDVSLAESCLDSMAFDLAAGYLSELCRVTNSIIYLSLIGAAVNDETQSDEIVVQTEHEQGTVQSYFDKEKIFSILKSAKDFKLASCVTETQENLDARIIDQRHYIILKRDG